MPYILCWRVHCKLLFLPSFCPLCHLCAGEWSMNFCLVRVLPFVLPQHLVKLLGRVSPAYRRCRGGGRLISICKHVHRFCRVKQSTSVKIYKKRVLEIWMAQTKSLSAYDCTIAAVNKWVWLTSGLLLPLHFELDLFESVLIDSYLRQHIVKYNIMPCPPLFTT